MILNTVWTFDTQRYTFVQSHTKVGSSSGDLSLAPLHINIHKVAITMWDAEMICSEPKFEAK